MNSNRSLTLVRLLLLALLTVFFAVMAMPAQIIAQDQEQQNAEHPPHYTVTDLGTSGGNCSFAFGINDRGLVDGFSNPSGEACSGALHAFVWHNGVMTDLGTLGGPNSQAFFGPNERGQAVGLAETSAPDPNGEDFCGLGTHLICLPFLWQAGVMTPLRTLGGNNGQAGDINNRGDAAGWAETSTPDPVCPAPQVLQFKPATWEKGEIQELPTFPGDQDGAAFGVNDRGQAVGTSGSCAAFDPDYGVPLQPRHALIWQDGTATDLGNLGGTINNIAFVVNNAGQVGGTSGLPGDKASHAFLWQKGVMIDLGTLPGDVDSGALDISRGRVVGASYPASGNSRAFLWQNGVMTDLNTLVSPAPPLFLLQANAINARGEIAGYGLTSAGDVHAFLATPIHSEAGSESTAPAAQGGTSESPKITLAENVRELLQQRLRFGRFGARLMGPQ